MVTDTRSGVDHRSKGGPRGIDDVSNDSSEKSKGIPSHHESRTSPKKAEVGAGNPQQKIGVPETPECAIEGEGAFRRNPGEEDKTPAPKNAAEKDLTRLLTKTYYIGTRHQEETPPQGKDAKEGLGGSRFWGQACFGMRQSREKA